MYQFYKGDNETYKSDVKSLKINCLENEKQL